jgi:hypothetical protein
MGKRVEQTVYIMDLKGGAMKILNGATYKFIKHCTSIGQDNYPEVLGKMFIINAPMFFYAVWNIIKIWVDEKTRNKVNILGSNFKKELLEFIDENDIPDFLGGKATVDEYGENMTNDEGPWDQYEKDMAEAEEAKKKAADQKQKDLEIHMKEEEEKKLEQKRRANFVNSSNKSFDINPDLIFDNQYDGDLEMWEVPVIYDTPIVMQKVKAIEAQILPAMMTLRTEMSEAKVKA